jgi:hypothetical protein
VIFDPDWVLLEADADEVLLGLLARDNEPQHHWPPPRFIPPFLERRDYAQKLRNRQRAEHVRQLAEQREVERVAEEAERARLAALQAEQARLAAQEAERARLVAVERAKQSRLDQIMADHLTRPQMAPSFVRAPEPIRRAARFLGPPPLAYILRRGPAR